MITLDPRKGSGELLRYFKPFGVHVELADPQLQFGDAEFWGMGPDDEPIHIGVERKVLGDFIQSMRDRRLAGHQLKGLLESYDYVYLIVEGIWRVGENGEVQVWRRVSRKTKWLPLYGGRRGGKQSVTYKEMDGHLSSLSHCAGLDYIRTPNETDTAAFIASRYNWWQKEFDEHRSHLDIYADYNPVVGRFGGGHRGRILRRTVSHVEKMLSQLPGVDRAAFDLAEYFGRDMQKVMKAGVEEIAEIRIRTGPKGKRLVKLGSKKAERIHKALRGKL